MEEISAHEHEIIEYALERLEEIPGVKVFGPSADKKGGVASFTFDGIHPHDVAQILDRDGIAVPPDIIAPNRCMKSLESRRRRVPASICIPQKMKWINWWKVFTKSRRYLDNIVVSGQWRWPRSILCVFSRRP